MGTFENYRRDKAYWFITYLKLAEAISADPSLRAKNYDLKTVVDEHIKIKQEMERIKRYGWFYDKS